MISKKEIVKYLESVGFSRQLGKTDKETKYYFIEVLGRSKNKWTYVFVNNNINATLRINRQFLTMITSNCNHSTKLVQINEEAINNIINKFISEL